MNCEGNPVFLNVSCLCGALREERLLEILELVVCCGLFLQVLREGG